MSDIIRRGAPWGPLSFLGLRLRTQGWLCYYWGWKTVVTASHYAEEKLKFSEWVVQTPPIHTTSESHPRTGSVTQVVTF